MAVKATRSVPIGPIKAGGSPSDLFLISGPCVIESRDLCMEVAEALTTWARDAKVPFVFKASFDKANRTSIDGFRGPGLEEGLRILQEVKSTFDVPILTDIHTPEQAAPASEVADILQIPAFLCRQTDLLIAAADSGAVVNVKKAQFLAAHDMEPVVKKIESTHNHSLMLTERGTCFGYNNLVVDMRGLVQMRELGYPVIFDATHSVQRPGGGGGFTSGDGHLAPSLARAAVALGIDGLFMETHLRPNEALSDKENAVPFAKLPAIWEQLLAIHQLVSSS